jgi:hypothetical protein
MLMAYTDHMLRSRSPAASKRSIIPEHIRSRFNIGHKFEAVHTSTVYNVIQLLEHLLRLLKHHIECGILGDVGVEHKSAFWVSG